MLPIQAVHRMVAYFATGIFQPCEHDGARMITHRISEVKMFSDSDSSFKTDRRFLIVPMNRKCRTNRIAKDIDSESENKAGLADITVSMIVKRVSNAL